MKIIIDGSFVSKKITGVQRFNWEVLRCLSKVNDLEIILAVSKDTDTSSIQYPNVIVVKFGKKNNKFWQFIQLGKYAKKMKLPVLGMSNFTPLFKKDYVVLHDVTYLDKEGLNNKWWAFKYKIFVGYHLHKHKKIFTVSEFSKQRILAHYKKIKADQIIVVGSGGEQWADVLALKPKFIAENEPYYLSVGSATNNKNFPYVIKLAEHNPNLKFLVVGRMNADISNQLENLSFTGYVSNEELVYLYRHCNGFILPSFYEGFGLPPLEALFCGCRNLILSDIPVFKEIYGTIANFFDPRDYVNTFDFTTLKEPSLEKINEILKKYTWENVALKIYDELRYKK